jgi:TPR repeat protein
MAHGQKMVDVGYFPGARAYFKRAAEAGSAEAALALGGTYDPALVAEIGARGIEPEPAQARAWYERARALGSADAEAKLIALARAAAPSQQADKAPLPAPAIVAAEAKTEAPREEWVELSGAANMREGPSGSAGTIKVAQKGERLRAIGRKGNWVQVSNPATKETGWIYSRFVKTLQAGE